MSSRFDRADPGQDPAYCDPLSDQQADGFVDPVESDLHDLISTLASLKAQTEDWRGFDPLMRLAEQLKPIEASLLAFRVRLMNRAEARTKEVA